MKLSLIVCEALLAAFFLAACGSDSGTDPVKKSLESNVQYETFDDLPNCTSNREGEIAEILDDEESYVCKSKKWEKYEKTELKSYKTEDNMPNCSAKNESSLALVEADSVVQVCKNSRWETLGHLYASEDALPNCTKKRDGEKAYLMEVGEVQVCNDGVWGAIKDNNDKYNESKSSDSRGSSSSKVTETSSDSKIESSEGKNTQSNNSGDIKSSDSGVPTSGSSGEEKSSSSVSGHSSTSIAPGVTEGTFTDPRDGQKCQNLNYDTGDDNSQCPLGKESYCEKYGRMYRDPYPGRCPKGWYVPHEAEWEELFGYVSLHNDGEGVGKSLKATSGWYEDGYTIEDSYWGTRIAVATGDDLFRFSALPAGSCWSWYKNEFVNCYSDDDALFWSREGQGPYKITFDRDSVTRDGSGRIGNVGASIRCIKSESGPIEIDSMPESVVVSIRSLSIDKEIEITSENLTHGGSDVFNENEAFYACPDGWRLPTNEEASLLIGMKYFDDERGTLHTSEGYCVWNSADLDLRCNERSSHPFSGLVRCVKE